MMLIQPPSLQDAWDFQATETVQLPGGSDEWVVVSEQVRGLTRWLSRERRLLQPKFNPRSCHKGGRRELMGKRCSLTLPTCMPSCACSRKWFILAHSFKGFSSQSLGPDVLGL